MKTKRLRTAAGQVQRGALECLGRRPTIDFLVVGAQKSGTTTLYEMLGRHPEVALAYRKELHYFDNQYERGLGWYRRQMPVEATHPSIQTGEATPYYLFHPEVPARVAAQLPDVKLIALLRDPTARAYSHYQHNLRRGVPLTCFAHALLLEDQLVADRGHLPGFADEPARHQHSYRARGVYVEQLERWYRLFPPEQLLVLRSETFFADPGATDRVREFLGLAPTPIGPQAVHHAGGYEIAPADVPALEELREYFRPYNTRLGVLLGEDFRAWDTSPAPMPPQRTGQTRHGTTSQPAGSLDPAQPVG